MSDTDHEFIKKTFVEVRKIETDRWFEGIRINRDPREVSNFDLEWVLKNAPQFAEQWSVSLCRNCNKWQECGHKLVPECKDHSTK